MRLRTHRRAQAEAKLKNRTSYEDHGLVFAIEPDDQQTPAMVLGRPCRALPGRHFRAVVKAAGVRPITFHGVRHTSATLQLAAGVPVQVVQQRLGHAKPSMTLDVYAHALPDMQQDAARRLDGVLAGR